MKKKKSLKLLGIIFFLALLFHTPALKADNSQKPIKVKIETISFNPPKIKIKVGDTVEWTNTSPIVHTVTADPKKATLEDSTKLPKGAKPFNSGNLEPNAVFRHTFTVPGTYRYFCIPHEAAMMRGEIVVEEKDKNKAKN